MKFSFGLLLIFTIFVGEVFSPVFLKKVRAQNSADERVITLSSEIQETNFETGVITARGNVRINYPAKQIQATAAQAQYFSKERKIVLAGNVYVLQQGNSMRAETMTYLIDEGRFIATPTPNGRVESIYLIPESNATSKPVRLPPTPSFKTQ